MLNNLTDSEVIEHFMTELRHPGVQGRIAECIIEYADTHSYEGLSPEKIAWRERMKRIRDANIEDPNVDRLVEELGKEVIESGSDDVISLIEGALISTKNRSKDLVQERRALRVLLDIREAAVRRGMDDAERWENIIDKIVPPSDR